MGLRCCTHKHSSFFFFHTGHFQLNLYCPGSARELWCRYRLSQGKHSDGYLCPGICSVAPSSSKVKVPLQTELCVDREAVRQEAQPQTGPQGQDLMGLGSSLNTKPISSSVNWGDSPTRSVCWKVRHESIHTSSGTCLPATSMCTRSPMCPQCHTMQV